jgi:4-amino-4-deoxy-L-arabinose transferase-like glycosyltransferase
VSDEADIGTQRAEAVTGVAPRSAEEKRKDFFAACGIFLFAFGLYLLPAAFSRPISHADEARVAVTAREMIQTGQYVVPTFAGEQDITPPLPYWVTAGAAQVLTKQDGLTDPVIRNSVLLPSALLAACAIFLVVMYGCAVFGRPAGVISGLLLAFCLLTTRTAQLGNGDAILLFTSALMFCSAAWIVTTARPGFFAVLGLGVGLGLSVLTRGLLPVVLLAAPVLLEVLLRHRLNLRKIIVFVAALVVAAGIAGAWLVALQKRAPGSEAFILADLQNSFKAASAGGFGYYSYALVRGLLPWTVLLVLGWSLYLTAKTPGGGDPSGALVMARRNLRFFLLSFATGMVVLSVLPQPSSGLLVMVVPALTLASAYALAQFRFPGGVQEERFAWLVIFVGVIVAAALATLPQWPDSVAQCVPGALTLKAIFAKSKLVLSLSVAAVALIVHLVSARQWVDGNPAAAVSAFAIAAYLGLAGWSWQYAVQTKNGCALCSEAPALRAKLDKDARVYGVGYSQAVLVYYLERSAFTADDLTRETSAKPGESAPERVLLFPRDKLACVEKDYGLTISEDIRKGKERVIVVPLPKEPLAVPETQKLKP